MRCFGRIHRRKAAAGHDRNPHGCKVARARIGKSATALDSIDTYSVAPGAATQRYVGRRRRILYPWNTADILHKLPLEPRLVLRLDLLRLITEVANRDAALAHPWVHGH